MDNEEFKKMRGWSWNGKAAEGSTVREIYSRQCGADREHCKYSVVFDATGDGWLYYVMSDRDEEISVHDSEADAREALDAIFEGAPDE